MSKRPTPIRPLPQPLGRRDFIKGLSASAAVFALAGCGDSYSYTPTNNGGNGFVPNPPNPNPPNPNPNPPNPNPNPNPNPLPNVDPEGGVSIAGRVNMEDFGGVPLNVQSLFQRDGEVAADGSFTTKASDTAPQLLFIVEPVAADVQAQEVDTDFFRGRLRGLGLALPKSVGDAALAFGAESTTVAMVFATLGILTVDPIEAVSRIARIKGLNAYPPLRDYVAAQIKTRTLGDLGKDATFTTLKQAAIAEFQTLDLLARQFDGPELAALYPKGLIKAEQNEEGVGFQNLGFRFVRVVRQELDKDGNPVGAPVRPTLANAITGGVETLPFDTDGILGGANQAGWGNLFTGQTFDPASASDNFKPDEKTVKIEYHVFGPGFAWNPPGPTLPPTLTPALIDATMPYALTTFYYMFLPLFDLISGGTAGKVIEKFVTNPATKKIFDQVADAAIGTAGVASAANGAIAADVSAMRGKAEDGIGNQNAAYLDLLAAITSVLAGLGSTFAIEAAAAALAGGAALTGGALAAGAAVIILAGIFAVGGAIFALTNVGLFLANMVRLPSVVKLDVGTGLGLELLGSKNEVQVLDINDDGALVYNKDGKLYLRQPGGAEVKLLDVQGDARINNDGDVLFQALDRLSDAQIRSGVDGSLAALKVPASSQSSFATGLAGISPRRESPSGFGPVGFAVAVRSDDNVDIYTNTIEGPLFTGTKARVGDFVSTVGVGKNILAGNAGAETNPNPNNNRQGFASSRTATLNIDTREWTKTVHRPGDLPANYYLVDVSSNDSILSTSSSSKTNDDEKPPEMSWPDWFFLSGQREVYSTTIESKVEGPNGNFSVVTTVDLYGNDPDSVSARSNHSVSSVNDSGDVVGELQPAGQSRSFPALWRKGQAAVNITTLFPEDSPTSGTWVPRLIRGSYILLERTTDADGEVYLFNLGR